LYDATTHVPLIIKLPRQKSAGKTIDVQVRTIDILPTILDLVGTSVPAQFDGESLKASLAGTDIASRPAVGETDYPLRFGWAPLRSLREGSLKFIQAPRPEFYDLQSDPKELQNKYAPDNPTAQKLQAQLGEMSPKSNDKKANSPEISSLPDPKDKIEEQNLLHDAMIASESDEPERARAALEKVLALDAKSPTALQQLGQLELAAKNYERAAAYLKRALEARPKDALAAFSLGQALDLSGDAEGARAALETTLKLNPSQFPARLLLGQIELKLNHLDAAADQLEAALLLQPSNSQAKISLGEVLIMQKRFSEAVQQLKPLSRTQPSQQLYELLSKGYAGMGKPEAAQRAQSRAKALASREAAR
jgi:predicted Zn-dependent protease